jgi:subfamily B ATP-binding cassette protein MsbA
MELYFRLLRFVKPYWVKLTFAMIFMSLSGGANGAVAFLVKPFLDKIFFEKNAGLLLLIPFGIVLLYLCKGAFEYFQAYLMALWDRKPLPISAT